MFIKSLRSFFIFGCVLYLAHFAFAQNTPGTIRGEVVDPSGAAVTNATVVLVPVSGPAITVTTNDQGVFEAKVPPGVYTLDVSAPGFSLYEKPNVEVAPKHALKLNIALAIAVENETVKVSGTTPTVQVNPEDNASSVVISGKALDALPDDPDELESDLTALAGPSAGPNGGQIYIDGFTGGQLPPKSSIREIRINQNPFSPQFDKLGYGRVEVFTKPGTDKLHGQLSVGGNDSAFNSTNPFAGAEPGYYSTRYDGSVGGPLSKSSSFFVSAQQRNINDLAAVNAVILDPNLDPTPFSEAVSTPRRRTSISPRFDFQLGKNNTLTARYQFFRDSRSNQGVGQFALASQGYQDVETEHTLQLSDTQIIGSKVVNETRFEYERDGETQAPVSTAPAIQVLQAFVGGGNSYGLLNEHSHHYELQNYTSMVHGSHVFKYGLRLRAEQDSNDSTTGFNGTFTFPSLSAYQSAEQQLQDGAATANGASQFTISSGTPQISVNYFDLGLYAGDDWRVRPNLTLSYGLRFETQNAIHDHADFAPRIGLAWGIGGKGGSPKTVLRAGTGIFYDRFREEYILQAERLNGITQQQYIVSNPDFYPMIPAPGTLTAAPDSFTRYQISPQLHAPYTVQTAVSLERQLGKLANLAVSYLNSRGYDQFLTRNINAPLSATDPTRPFGSVGNIYQYSSSGIFRQNQLITNVNLHASSNLWLFGYYVLNYANSDTDGASSFPSNQYDLMADYGRASFASRNRLFLGGTIGLPFALRLSPFLIATSGYPYDITLQQDLNGDSIFNDRPGLVSTDTCASVQITGSVYCTPLGTFDSTPSASQRIVPVNYATGPGRFSLNARLSKTFGFGPKAEAGHGFSGGDGHHHGHFGMAGGGFGLGNATDRRYSLTLTVHARNIFNKINLATPNGTLGSPLFAESNALAGGPFGSSAASRRIDLQASFNF